MTANEIDAHELKARWGFSEARSPRWSADYASVKLPTSFDDTSPETREELVAALTKQRPHLAPAIDAHEKYETQLWSKEQLGRAYTILRMAPSRNANIPFLSFIACPRFDEDSDPRVQADAVPFDEPFVQTEGAIILPIADVGPILIEGYFRSVIFMRTPDPNARIAVWYPL